MWQINHMEANLVGAMRREKMAEIAVRKLEAEIEHVNLLVYLLLNQSHNFLFLEKKLGPIISCYFSGLSHA